MDKNTVIGLGLIGVILATFTYFNKPSDAEIKAQKEKAKKEIAIQQEEIKKEQDKYNTSVFFI